MILSLLKRDILWRSVIPEILCVVVIVLGQSMNDFIIVSGKERVHFQIVSCIIELEVTGLFTHISICLGETENVDFFLEDSLKKKQK